MATYVPRPDPFAGLGARVGSAISEGIVARQEQDRKARQAQALAELYSKLDVAGDRQTALSVPLPQEVTSDPQHLYAYQSYVNNRYPQQDPKISLVNAWTDQGEQTKFSVDTSSHESVQQSFEMAQELGLSFIEPKDPDEDTYWMRRDGTLIGRGRKHMPPEEGALTIAEFNTLTNIRRTQQQMTEGTEQKPTDTDKLVEAMLRNRGMDITPENMARAREIARRADSGIAIINQAFGQLVGDTFVFDDRSQRQRDAAVEFMYDRLWMGAEVSPELAATYAIRRSKEFYAGEEETAIRGLPGPSPAPRPPVSRALDFILGRQPPEPDLPTAEGTQIVGRFRGFDVALPEEMVNPPDGQPPQARDVVQYLRSTYGMTDQEAWQFLRENAQEAE